MTPQQRLLLETGALHVHHCGARTLAELLAEVAEQTGQLPLVLEALAAYRRLPPALLRAVGGDRFPGRRLAAVPDDLRRTA
jgi:hypothetical protein